MLQFRNNGNKIPQIGYGTHELKGDICYDGIKHAIQFGYRHIDTASVYKNEEIIGKALFEIFQQKQITRNDLFITSKLSPFQQGYDNAVKGCEEILKKLQIDYLDLLLIHWPGSKGLKVDDPKNAEIRLQTYRAMEYLKEIGKVRDIGVSNFMVIHLKHLKKNCKVMPVLNQFELHPFCVDQATIQFCKDNNIVIEAYSSLARNQDILVQNQVLQKISNELNKSIQQIALKWAVQNQFVVIPRSRNPVNIQQNFQLYDFELNQDQMDQINQLNQNLHVCWDPNTILY